LCNRKLKMKIGIIKIRVECLVESSNIIRTNIYFFEVKIVKRIFLLERMNSGEGVPGQPGNWLSYHDNL